MSDGEGHGHWAILYKSQFPPLRHSVFIQLLERHRCIHRLINHVYYKGQVTFVIHCPTTALSYFNETRYLFAHFSLYSTVVQSNGKVCCIKNKYRGIFSLSLLRERGENSTFRFFHCFPATLSLKVNENLTKQKQNLKPTILLEEPLPGCQ